MLGTNPNPLSVGQINADLFMAASAIQKAETISSKAGKHLRGLAGYHLRQAAEKMIKLQIYASSAQIDHSKMYHHSLDDLMAYAGSLGIGFSVVNRLLNCFAGDDFALFFKMSVPESEFLQGAVVEGFLIVQNELVPVSSFQRHQLYIGLL